MTHLAPCPKCRSELFLEIEESCRVRCCKCGYQGGSSFTRRGAIANWNHENQKIAKPVGDK